KHQRETNPLADQPSVRLCRFALLEISDMIEFGTKCVAALVNSGVRSKMSPWLSLLDDCLAAAGGFGGTEKPIAMALARIHSAGPYKYDGVPKRDERFPDPYNMGVNAEVFLYDQKFPPEPKTLMMFYKRLREIDVPEMMSSIITETPDKPWGY